MTGPPDRRPAARRPAAPRPAGRPSAGRRAAVAGVTAALLAAAAALAAVHGLPWRIGAADRTRCRQEAFVPAYFYPGAGWTRAIDSRPPPRLMILDVTSAGAGRAPDRDYQAAVRRATAAGITVLGYASTDYGRRPAAAVRADVLHYRAWYRVTGIFLDEVSASPSRVGYYRRLAGFIRAADSGGLVMLNPGTYPARQYMSIGDVVVVFEGSYASYRRLRVPRWASRYSSARFATAIYATPERRLASVLALSARRRAGYVYVTASAGSNPYGSLPGYWPSEDSLIAAACRR